MNHTSAIQVNPQGGLMVEREDGTFFYCAPDEDQYVPLLEYFGQNIAPYVSREPSPEALLAIQMRAQRDALLSQLDTLVSNPLRWAEYTADQQAALAAYRQALLDVPQQVGFPSEIDWPEMPAF